MFKPVKKNGRVAILLFNAQQNSHMNIIGLVVFGAVVPPTEKSHEFICSVTSYFGRNGGTGGNVSERYKRDHRQVVVGENGQLTVSASYGFPVT